MEDARPKALVVDDETHILKTVGICLDSIGMQTFLFSKPQEALNICRKEVFDLAFVDLKMGPIDGIEMLAEIKKASPNTTVIIITAHGSVDTAVEAIKKGAYHYLQKPFDFKELQIFAQRALEYHQLSSEVQELRKQVSESKRSGNFITRNKAMLEVLDLARKVADSNLSVLIEGESGTGKELIAEYIHQNGPRADKPMVKVNCAALPEELLESELFGHVRGAFTGALRDRQGRFELADGGTAFLDEIAEISPGVQAKLLRVIQNKEFERVGESMARKVDVRIIAATNRNLDEALKEGTFREDLFYRLNAIRIKLSPLRERPEDIPLLVQHILKSLSKEKEIQISPEAMKAIRAYRWSGNVRELENVLERATLLMHNGTIELAQLPEEVCSALEKPSLALSLEEVEKLHIKRILQYAKDFEEAAVILGIDPATLWRKRRKYNL
jgi:NtrC-family two-component system response regulator AlgB